MADNVAVAAAPSDEADIERHDLVETARSWGYFSGSIKTRKDLWYGKRILDIGMGAGPHSISFVEQGAASYVGVDPLIGSQHVRDFRSLTLPSIPAYHAFPYSTDDISRIYPNIHLYSGFLEDVVEQVKRHKVDVAMMAAVSEHLRYPDKVIKSIWEILDRGGLLWISHCNYYSWTGHHYPPRSVAAWNPSNPEENQNVDWKHLEPSHRAYSNPNFNRVRLEDLRLVIAKYFELIEWKISVEGMTRLTPEIRKKWKKYSLAELLGQNIYITGRRRDEPLDIDFKDRQLFHPDEQYLADRDYSNEDLAAYDLKNSVYFSNAGELCSHSDNDSAGLRVFERLKPGDTITLTKFTSRLKFTVASLVQPAGAAKRVKLVEPMPPEIKAGNLDQWTIEI